MNIKWNKVTWYSKLAAVVLFVLIFYLGFRLGREKKEISNPNEISQGQTTKDKTSTLTPISISTQNIREENFSGTMPAISGSSPLASSARSYVSERIDEFRIQANKDVPDMRDKFGADSPAANYTIDVEATKVQSKNTESIVISEYAYTGGANGNSSYKVITASRPDGKILSLSDKIIKDEQDAFTEFVKKELNNWRPGTDAPVVFPDEVKNLTFDFFANWSLTDKNLTIYFDKYDIGPGALGAVAFPLPLQKIEDFLK